MPSLLIKNGRLIDPASGLDGTFDLLVKDSHIAAVEPPGALDQAAAQVFEAQGLWVLPGFIDMHVHLRDPGHQYKEDLGSGLRAAAAGGFTAVLAMPNTSPPIDQAEIVLSLIKRSQDILGAKLLVSAAMTRGRKGQELTEYNDLSQAGAIAVTDDGSWVSDAAVMRRILDYAYVCNLLPLSHTQEPTLARDGQINEGHISTKLGLAGIPSQVEEIAVYRDIALVRLTGKPLHLCHLSTAKSLELVKAAKKEGLPVSAETAPHYFHLTDSDLLGYNTNFKMNPPLRTALDKQAVIEALLDGTIDAVATDHAPHSVLEKEVEFNEAAFGVIGLETAFSLLFELTLTQGLPPKRLVELLSANPSKLLSISGGSLAKGQKADLTVVDPKAQYVYNVAESKSKSRNSPFSGRTMNGRVVLTVVNGEISYQYPLK
jgi:dihydroorotase